MKVIDILNQAAMLRKPRFSFELLPPLKGDGPDKIYEAIHNLLPYNPAFVNFTCHREEMRYIERPDGLIEKHIARRRPGTVGISAAIMREFNIEVVPHIICGGQSRYDIEDQLIDLNLLGIDNVLALRGDAMPGDTRFTPHPQGHAHAEDLVCQITHMNQGIYIDREPNTNHNTTFCIGVAGYPEKHIESPNIQSDLYYLKQKVDAGASYIATQICYGTDTILRFRDRCTKAGIDVPILPGLKPLGNKTQLTIIPQTFAIDIPQALVEAVQKCPDNNAVQQVGINWTTTQAQRLIAEGFPIIHFYTMTRTDQVIEIVKRVFGE